MFAWARRAGVAWRQSLSVLLAGMLLSAGATWALDRSEDAARRRSLELDSLRLANDLRAVVPAHTALLSALRSLYKVNQPLTRAQFHDFVIGGKLLDQHPGAQAYEFARRVSPADLGSYEQSVQAKVVTENPSYPPFDIHPPSTREDHWVVEYLEPVVHNEAAFGLDLGDDDSRRQAVEAACRGDRPAATTPIRLVQESGTSRGLVVLSPLYDVDTVPATPAERWTRCVGLMIVVYRVDDIMATLRRQNVHIGFELADLGIATAAAPSRDQNSVLLFDTDTERQTSGAVHRVVLEFHGRQWELAVNESATPIVGVAARTIGLIGVAFSLVVAALVLQLATFRRRALTRGRVVAAGDRDRRSLERDLHDGAQQRLLGVSLTLAEARQRPQDPATNNLLSKASAELANSLQELRDLAHGLHPAVLTNHGLAVALEGVAAQAPLPVDLHLDLPQRLPAPIEAAAYYVVCEVVTNAVKHAMAKRIRVSVCQKRQRLAIDVQDDGIGGARRTTGSGLQGLADRVEALDGRFRVQSAKGKGTWIRAYLPFE